MAGFGSVPRCAPPVGEKNAQHTSPCEGLSPATLQRTSRPKAFCQRSFGAARRAGRFCPARRAGAAWWGVPGSSSGAGATRRGASCAEKRAQTPRARRLPGHRKGKTTTAPTQRENTGEAPRSQSTPQISAVRTQPAQAPPKPHEREACPRLGHRGPAKPTNRSCSLNINTGRREFLVRRACPTPRFLVGISQQPRGRP